MSEFLVCSKSYLCGNSRAGIVLFSFEIILSFFGMYQFEAMFVWATNEMYIICIGWPNLDCRWCNYMMELTRIYILYSFAFAFVFLSSLLSSSWIRKPVVFTSNANKLQPNHSILNQIWLIAHNQYVYQSCWTISQMAWATNHIAY